MTKMRYRIIINDKYRKRGEAWNKKDYASKEQAQAVIDRAKKKFKSLDKEQGGTYKIVKKKPSYNDRWNNMFG